MRQDFNQHCNLGKFPDNWKEHLPEAYKKHIASKFRIIKVHLARGSEALIYWPAFYIDHPCLYYSGEITFVTAQNISRPGNFILQTIAKPNIPIVLRKNIGRKNNIYHFACMPANRADILKLSPSDWRICNCFRVIDE